MVKRAFYYRCNRQRAALCCFSYNFLVKRHHEVSSICAAFDGLPSLCQQCPAEARPASHSGTSSSYKSGFSSQKSNSAAHSRPAPPAANRQSGPGAFGQQTGSPAQPQRATSAMSRDVDQSAARANALKTLDERRAAANAPPPLPPLNDSLRQPQQARAPVYQLPPPVYAPPASGSNALMAWRAGLHAGPGDEPEQPAGGVSDHAGQPACAAPAPPRTARAW
jgi:hypothetical protein